MNLVLATAALTKIPDIIFVSLENWDEIWRRNQFICSGLAKRFPEARILFVGLPLDVSHSLRRGTLAGLSGDTTFGVPGISNITATRPLKLFPNSIAVGRMVNQWMMRAHVQGVARKLLIKRPILWINDHSSVHMIGRMEETGVVYDITDDWETLKQPKKQAERASQQDAELGRKASAVIVCSKQLRERRERKFGRAVHLIPNGVDHEHYARCLQRSANLPCGAKRWPKPVFGYTGTLHRERLDLSLIESVAKALKGGTIVLLGPNFLDEASHRRMVSLNNVVIHEAVPYGEIPEYMGAFDVCIAPHQVTEFTDSLNPIKLWEYLATGKPIVSTRIAGFRQFPQFVRLADTPEEFLSALSDSLRDEPRGAEARRAEARRNSWDARVAEVSTLLSRF